MFHDSTMSVRVYRAWVVCARPVLGVRAPLVGRTDFISVFRTEKAVGLPVRTTDRTLAKVMAQVLQTQANVLHLGSNPEMTSMTVRVAFAWNHHRLRHRRCGARARRTAGRVDSTAADVLYGHVRSIR